MDSDFHTLENTYSLKVDKFVCNKFGIAEFFAANFAELKKGSGAAVLDVGCGVGTIGVYLADQYGCSVVGVELNRAACECGRENISRFQLSGRMEVCRADFSSYGALRPDAGYDLIVSIPPIDDGVSAATIKYYAGCKYDTMNEKIYSYITNSWHDEQGMDILGHIFLYATGHLRENGAVAIAFCEIDGASVESVSVKAMRYGFSVARSVTGTISSQSIGVESMSAGAVRANYLVFKHGGDYGNQSQ